ncbi:MAG: MBL fold metallo-hydrolase [Conexivisphaera sp.]
MRPLPLRLVVGPLMSNAYLLCEGPDCVLVDPGGDPDTILPALGGRRLRAIVATHMHFDHVWGAREIVGRTGAVFVVHRMDWELRRGLLSMSEELGFAPPDPPDSAELVEDGQEVWGGVRAMHTPGHTPGSLSLVGDGFVITGDLLFAGSVGRTDIPWSDPAALRRSVCRLYRELPPDTVVLPGHGPATTIGAEASSNPFVNSRKCGISPPARSGSPRTT